MAAIAGETHKHSGLRFILDGNTFRMATPQETVGIVIAQSDIDLAEKLADDLPRFSWDDDGDWLVDAIEAEADWNDYCDTVNSVRSGILMF